MRNTPEYSILLDQDRRPVVIKVLSLAKPYKQASVLWVFSPEKAVDVAQALDRVPSQPLSWWDVRHLTVRAGADFAAFAPDHLSPSALRAYKTVYRCYRLTPSRWDLVSLPPEFVAWLRGAADADALELMNAPSSQFTAKPRETAPEEYAGSGELLKAQRERAGLTQAALAEKSGVDVRMIERIEARRTKPHSKTVRLLAKALGIPRAALLGWEFDKGVKVDNKISFDPALVDRNVWEQRGNVWKDDPPEEPEV
jgi:transcriptional regulator with XRE-family HTH domain